MDVPAALSSPAFMCNIKYIRRHRVLVIRLIFSRKCPVKCQNGIIPNYDTIIAISIDRRQRNAIIIFHYMTF